MSSRVVHTRIDDRTLYLLYQLDKILWEDIENYNIRPMASVVSSALGLFVEKLVAAGKLPDVPEESAQALLDELLERDRLEEEFEDIFTEAVAGIDIPDVERDITAASNPIEAEHKLRSPDEHPLDEQPEVLSPIDPWDEVDVKPFDYFKDKAPMDALIEAAVADSLHRDNVTLQRAIQCIYSNLPLEMWGTEKAQNLVADILPTIQKYEEREKIEKENEA